MTILDKHRKCLYCGQDILSSYYYDWAGNAICSKHGLNAIQRCVSCQRFVDTSAADIGNGIKLCRKCQANLITMEAARKLIDNIKILYRNCGIGEISGCNIEVEEAQSFFARSGNFKCRGLAHRYGSQYTIYILRSVSQVVFADVLAHEKLHIWQYNHNCHPDSFRCEGFCNLGSYYILTKIKNPESEARIQGMLDNQDPIYGEGFRYMKNIYDKTGWPGAIAEISIFKTKKITIKKLNYVHY